MSSEYGISHSATGLLQLGQYRNSGGGQWLHVPVPTVDRLKSKHTVVYVPVPTVDRLKSKHTVVGCFSIISLSLRGEWVSYTCRRGKGQTSYQTLIWWLSIQWLPCWHQWSIQSWPAAWTLVLMADVTYIVTHTISRHGSSVQDQNFSWASYISSM